jgi:hypothetical protein
MAKQINYQTIRKRVEKRIKQRQEYFMHLAIYVIVNLCLWGIWFFTSRSFPWPAIPMLAWGIGIGIHSVEYFFGASMERNREEMIEREIRREKMRLYGDPDYDDAEVSKPKRHSNDRNVRLTDDGEIVDGDTEVEAKRVSRRKSVR